MKRILTLLFFLMTTCLLPGQTFTKVELESTIKEVTVFLQAAHLTRTGEMEVEKGPSTLLIKNLSPHLEPKSIQVKAEGDFTILSVNHDFNYLDSLSIDASVDSLKNIATALEFDISTNQARLEVLTEKQSLLSANKSLGGETAGVSIDQLTQAIALYEQELSSIKTDELSTKLKIKKLRKHKNRVEQELAHIKNLDQLPTSEIEIRIEAKEKTIAEFKLSYLVTEAGWYPKYNVRVKNVEQPLELDYKAEVYQNTGIDWEQVKLKFSNGDPNKSGVAPALQTWHLNYARNTIYKSYDNKIIDYNIGKVSGKILDEDGYPLIGATIQIKGTTVGTVTDLEGNYSLALPAGASHLVISYVGFNAREIPITSNRLNATLESSIEMLEEVVVTGYALSGRASGVSISNNNYTPQKAKTITTTTIENTTTVEFEVDRPYSIPSNGEALSVHLKTLNIETSYEYYAVPKLDKDAFLIAKIINWDQYNLLEGEANLYFEDAYVGRSLLDATSLSDTLSISLGRDKNILIGREKITDFSKRKTVGRNKIESRGFKIIARNKKSQTIQLTLFDQIPVSAISDISVTPKELSGAQLEEKIGKLSWKLLIPAQEQVKLNLAYEVKYPKREKIKLE